MQRLNTQLSFARALILMALLLGGCQASSSSQPTTAAPSTDSTTENETQQDAAIPGELLAAFKSWLKKHDIPAGALAVSFKGQPVLTGGTAREATAPANIASLSKAITAVCAMNVITELGKSVDQTLLEVMPELLASSTVADDRFGSITIGQLMTHDSGIHSLYEVDLLRELPDYSTEQKLYQLEKILAENLAGEPGSGYHYANANYLILGIVIETWTAESYESACLKRVFAPIGVTTAKLDNYWRLLSSYGGWSISASDYLTFVDHYFGNNKILDESPKSFPALSEVDSGVTYGPGTLIRATNAGYNFWHAGAWRWLTSERTDMFGSFFAAYDIGYTVVVNYDHDAYFDGELNELEAEFHRIVRKL